MMENTYDGVFLAKVVNVFQPFSVFAKKLRHSCVT